MDWIIERHLPLLDDEWIQFHRCRTNRSGKDATKGVEWSLAEKFVNRFLLSLLLLLEAVVKGEVFPPPKVNEW